MATGGRSQMKQAFKKILSVALAVVIAAGIALTLNGCGSSNSANAKPTEAISAEAENTYTVTDYPLNRNGIELHLDRTTLNGKKPLKNILLTHGVTYSSHEFDIDYKDYSLVRFLARKGYAVWKLDIAGFGQSGEVKDGFMPDSDYAAEDINAAVELVVKKSGQEKIDLLGWSWGTVTASRYAIKYKEHLDRLILYAPILSGIGEYEVNEDFHHNTWEHAADDFQHDSAGNYDHSITEPEMIEMFCSSCWRYDGEQSPNGGRRDICVDRSNKLIDLKRITVPTLVICGDNDPYLNYDLVNASLDDLPQGSQLEVIKGGAHVIMYEKPYYHEFQDKLIGFLEKE